MYVLALALINLPLQRYRPDTALRPGELMTVYVFLSFTSLICSVDFLDVMIPLIAYPHQLVSPENRLEEVFFGTDERPGPVASWLLVTDPEALRGLHEGHSTLYSWPVLRAWAGPLFWWTTFIVALLTAIITLTAIFRRQWTEKERLAYPVIQIPLEIATNLQGLLSNRLFWYGFGIAAGVNLLNGLNFLEPRIPGIPLLKVFDFKDYLVGPPWTGMGSTFVSLHLFAVGMLFFLPTDLIFSCWFFFMFYRAQQVLAGASGAYGMPGFPFTVQQSAGAYLGLCLLALWISRRHLREVALTILGRPGGVDDGDEPLRYRRAALVLALCTAYMIGFGVAAGASWWMLVLFFLLFYAFSIAIARLRAELGPPAHDLHFSGPDQLLHQAFGTRGAGGGTLAVFAMFFFFNRAYRSHAAPHAIEGFKIAERLGMSPRRLLAVMLAAVVIGLGFSYWALLHSLYINGLPGTASFFMGRESWLQLAGHLQNPQPPNVPATVAVLFGVVFSILLGLLRMAFAWWPFHPVGYATSATWSMDHLWFSMLVAWALKVTLLRYGGARVYRPAVPFFIGLVLGEFVLGSAWTIYGIVYGVQVYNFWGRG